MIRLVALVCGLLCSALGIAPLAAAAAPEPQQLAELGTCKLVNGTTIEGCRIGYRTYGRLNSTRTNIVVFPTWYNGRTADVTQFVRSGGLLDPDKYFIVAIDALGDGVSSSPSVASEGQRATAFPHFAIADMVDIEHRFLTTTFHVDHVHAVMGISMGGMQAFQWSARYPHFMDVVIAINGTPWLTAADRLTWSIMRQSILLDPDYRKGAYDKEPPLNLGNEVDAMFSYTGAYRARATSLADFQTWLAQTHAQESVGANNRLWQIDAIEHQDVLQGAGAETLEQRDLPRMLIVASSKDQTVNPLPSLEWAKRTRSQLFVLDGDCGHLAPLCEMDKLAPVVAAALAG